jgi:hypothetical protein
MQTIALVPGLIPGFLILFTKIPATWSAISKTMRKQTMLKAEKTSFLRRLNSLCGS